MKTYIIKWLDYIANLSPDDIMISIYLGFGFIVYVACCIGLVLFPKSKDPSVVEFMLFMGTMIGSIVYGMIACAFIKLMWDEIMTAICEGIPNTAYKMKCKLEGKKN